jgi:RNA polymerase sigma factor (sigma-70 family)
MEFCRTPDRDEISKLWLSHKEGDKKSFEILYRMFYPMLYAYGLKFRVDEEAIRDIIQELFVQLYTKPEIINNPTTIRAFLFMSVRNACINQLAYASKCLRISNFSNLDSEFTVENENIKDQEEEHLKQQVETVLNGLTPRQREIIYLRFLYELDYEEISRIMNLSGQAARNLIHRAIEHARKIHGK